MLASKIYKKLQAAINNIEHYGWTTLKRRYIFARKLAADSLNIQKNGDNSNALVSGIEDIFWSGDNDVFSLIKRYTRKDDTETKEFISEIEDEANKISDKEFTLNICTQGILNEFFKEYKEWRMRTFPSKLVQIICDYIEELNPSSKSLLYIHDISEGKCYACHKIDFFLK